MRRKLLGVLLAIAAGACTTGGQTKPVPMDQSGYDHSSFNPRPHDYETLGVTLLSGTVTPTTTLFQSEPNRCGEQEFSFNHGFYIADQVHTAWHIYEESSPRTFDRVTVTVTEYEPTIECHPNPEHAGEIYCITSVSLGLDLETSGGGGPTLKDHGWISSVRVSFPERCEEANHRIDTEAAAATEGAIGELFKSVARTDEELAP